MSLGLETLFELVLEGDDSTVRRLAPVATVTVTTTTVTVATTATIPSTTIATVTTVTVTTTAIATIATVRATLFDGGVLVHELNAFG